MLLTKPPKSYNYQRISKWSWDLAGSVERHTRKHKYKKLVSHNSDDKLINTSYTLTSWRTLNISKNYLWSLSSWVSHKSVVSLSNSRAKRERVTESWARERGICLRCIPIYTATTYGVPSQGTMRALGLDTRTWHRHQQYHVTSTQPDASNPTYLWIWNTGCCRAGPSFPTANDMSLIYYSD